MSWQDKLLINVFVACSLVESLYFHEPDVAVGFVACAMIVYRTARPKSRSYDVEIKTPTIEYVLGKMKDPDRCRVDPYYASGPVTPMSREEAEEDRRVMSHRCARGTAGCFVEHQKP